MTTAEHLSDEDLVAYGDHDLPWSERQRIRQHLADCPTCRQRLEEFRWVDRVLNASGQKYDDHTYNREMIGKLRRASERNLFIRTILRPTVAIAAVVIVLAFFGQPITSTAGDGVSRFIQFASDIRGSGQTSATTSEGPPGVLYVPPEPGPWNPNDFSFTTVAPRELPPGLVLQGGSSDSPDRLTLTYQSERSDSELQVLLTEGPVGTMEFGASAGDTERIVVDDSEVLMGHQEFTNQVTWMFWERAGLAFEVFVFADPAAELTTEKALQLVAALNQAHDRTSDE